MFKEFKDFLKEYGVIGLAIAVIIGGKLNGVVTTMVDGVLMPLITYCIPNGEWRTHATHVGPFTFLLGPFFAALVDFTIVAIFVFLIAKFVLREAKVTKK